MENTPSINIEVIVEELLLDKIEVMDLPPILDLLKSIDDLLIKEFDKEFNTISLNKVRETRKSVLERIEWVNSKEF